MEIIYLPHVFYRTLQRRMMVITGRMSFWGFPHFDAMGKENPGKIIFHDGSSREQSFDCHSMSLVLVHHRIRGMFIKINSSIKPMHRPRELNRL